MSTPGAAPIGLGAGQAGSTGTVQDRQRWFPILNGSGEVIPSFAIVRLTDGERLTASEGYRVHTVAAKPNGADDAVLAITGYGIVPSDPTNKGKATQDYPAWVAYNPAEWTPANGDRCGARADSWLAHPDQDDFVVIGPATTDGGLSKVLVTSIAGGSADGFPGPNNGCCAGCICMPAEVDQITACAAVPCLAGNYKVVGRLPFAGNVTLAHDTGCIFLSDSFNIVICGVDYGAFHWKLTVSADPHGSILELVNDGTGADIPLLYKTFKAPFHPICGNTFALYFDCAMPDALAHVFPCEVCVVAVGDECEKCDPATTQACCAAETPLVIQGSLSDNLNSSGFTGTFSMTHDPTRLPAFGGSWYGTITTCGGAVLWEFQLTCCTAISGTDTFDWVLNMQASDLQCTTNTIPTTGPVCDGFPPEAGATCDPLNIVFLIPFGSFCPCNNSGGALPGNGYLTITAP